MPRPGRGRAACARPGICAEQKARGRLTGSGPATGIAKLFSRALPLRLPKSFADITDGPTWAVADGVFSWPRRANGSGVPGAVLCRVGLRAAGFRLASVAGVILTLITVLPAQAEDPPSWPVVSTEPGQVLYVPSGSFGTATAAAALHGNVTIVYDDPNSDDPYVAVPVNEPWFPGPSYGVMNWITRGGATIYVPFGSTVQGSPDYDGAFIDAQTEHSSFLGNPTTFINDGIVSFYGDGVEILALHGFDFRNTGTIEIGNILLQNVEDPAGDVLFQNTGRIQAEYIFLFNMGVPLGPTGTDPYEGDIVLHNLGTSSIIEGGNHLIDLAGSGRIDFVNQGTIRVNDTSPPNLGITIRSTNDSHVAIGSLNELRPFQQMTVRNEGIIQAGDALKGGALYGKIFRYAGYGTAGDLSRLLMPAGTELYNGPGAPGTATANARARIVATDGTAVSWAAGGTITNHGDIIGTDAGLFVDQWARVTEVELGSHPFCSSILGNCLRWIEVVNPLTVVNGADGVISGGDAGIVTFSDFFNGDSVGADEAFFYSGTSGPLLTIRNAGDIWGAANGIDSWVPTRVENEGNIGSNGEAVGLSSYNDVLVNTGTIDGIVRLYAGDDYLDNRGTITGAIELGSGNDGFVWWLNGSTAAGPIDAGSGTDSLLFGVDAGPSVTLTSLADPQIPAGAPTGFEGIGKAGAGALTLGFDGDIETGAFDMAGGTLVLKDRLVVSAIPGLDGSGRVNFRDETGLGALFVSEQGIVADSLRMTGSGITFRNLGTLTIASGTFAADDGSQRIENSGNIALFLDFNGALDGPGDVLVNDGVISVTSGRAVYMERGSFTNTGRIETDRANFEAVVINGVMNAPSLNTGTIGADGNAVEISDLGGTTFTNRGTMESTNWWAGLAVFGGSGTIVNGRAADGSAALMRGGSGGGNAVYAEEMGDLLIENQGLMEGTYTISAYRNAMTTIVNSGQITADADAGGSDAINLGDGNVLVQNLAGGVISANGDAFWIENRVAAYETRIENAAGAFIIGDNSATDTVTYGRAINVLDDVTAGGVTTFVPSREIVSNAGTIRGDISLASGSDRLTVLETGIIEGEIDLGTGDDELRIRAGGRFSGSASGGAGAGDALLVDHAAGSPALTIGATTFSGFETVNLNAAGTTGTFRLAGDTAVSPDAATGVLFQSETGRSQVWLQGGRMVGNGAIGGDLSVMAGAGGGAGAVIAPGNSIGRIKVKDYLQTGAYEAEFRVPEAALFQRRDGALVGRNPVDMPGLVLADQDADLVWASGSADITGGFLISQFGSTSTIAAAMAAPDNTTGQVRYLLATAPVLTGLPAAGYLVLGDPDGNPATTERIVMTDRDGNGTADSVELVFQSVTGGGGGTGGGGTGGGTGGGGTGGGGTGGGGTGGDGGGGTGGGDSGGGGVFPAVVAPTLPESFQLRPERVTGCLDRAIVAWGPGGASQGRCLWASIEGLTGGEADLGDNLREDLGELQLDFGAETRLSTGAEDTDARLGVLLGYRQSESTLSTGSSASADTLRLGLYAELTSGPVEGSASLIWGMSDISTQRTGVAGRLLSGETDGQALSFDIQAERWIATQQPDLTWAPYAGLSYTSASRDGFTETGDSLEAFSYDDAKGYGLWARLGLRGRHDVAAAPGRNPARIQGGIGIETLLSGDGLGVAGAFGPYPIPASPGASRFDDTALLLDLAYDAVLSTRGQRVTEFTAALGLRSTGSATDASLELQLRTSW